MEHQRGLAGAPASFQAMMDVLLAGLKWNTCLIYLDDVVLFSSTIDQHLMRLEAVLIRIMEANLRIKLKKCHFFESILKILGFVVDKNGILPDPAKLRAVRDYPSRLLRINSHRLRFSVILTTIFRSKFIQMEADLGSEL